MTKSRARTALAALAALAASASAAHPAPAAVNCSRHIRVGVFDDANPFAASFLTGWMDSATACYSFHHMSTGNRAMGPRGQHRGAFFRASVANLDA